MAYIVNESVPLNIQLADANQYPRATIYGPSNTVIGGPIPLPYIAKGNYGVSSFLMPNLPWIKVIYEVFTDSAYTIPSTIYGNSVDIFDLDQSSGGGGGEASTSGFVITGEIIQNQEIIGVIES